MTTLDNPVELAPSTSLMETNIDLRLQEDELGARPIEILAKVPVDPNKPNRVLKTEKNLKSDLAE